MSSISILEMFSNKCFEQIDDTTEAEPLEVVDCISVEIGSNSANTVETHNGNASDVTKIMSSDDIISEVAFTDSSSIKVEDDFSNNDPTEVNNEVIDISSTDSEFENVTAYVDVYIKKKPTDSISQNQVESYIVINLPQGQVLLNSSEPISFKPHMEDIRIEINDSENDDEEVDTVTKSSENIQPLEMDINGKNMQGAEFRLPITSDDKASCDLQLSDNEIPITAEKSLDPAVSYQEKDSIVNTEVRIFMDHSYSRKSVTTNDEKVHYIYTCEVCEKTFDKEQYLKRHLVIHYDKKPFSCPTCDKSFAFSCNLHRHLRVHSGEKPYSCDFCGVQFTQSTTVKVHQRLYCSKVPRVTQYRRRNFSCPKCHLTYSSAFRLEKHTCRDEHAGTDKPPPTCDFCGQTFLRVIGLLIHRKSHLRAIERSLKSEENGTSCSNDSPSTIIKRTRKPRQKSEMVCPGCKVVFKRRITLCEHQATTGCCRNFICTVCNRYFSSACNLEIHSRVHTGEKPFKCNQCFRSFNSAANHIRHLRTHTGYRPFKCTICFRAFSQSTSLDTHMRVHSGERPFKCTECEKSFTDFSTLRRHRFIHTGDKPFKCPICYKGFICHAYLQQHASKMHSTVD